MAAKGVREAPICHILNINFFFLSTVALMFCFSNKMNIKGTKRPKQIYEEKKR